MFNVINKRRIFIDFDGTVVDIWDRCYEIYKNAKSQFGLNIFHKETYLKHKKRNCSEKDIILKNNKQSLRINKYLSFRIRIIENKKYLDFDRLIINKKKIGKIIQCYDLYLITMRHNRFNLLWELEKIGIDNLFKEIACRKRLDKQQNEFEQKKKLLSRFCPFSSEDTLIGDTEIDYSLGKYFDMQTFIVESGMCNSDMFLKNYPYMSNVLYWNINNVFNNLSGFCKITK